MHVDDLYDDISAEEPDLADDHEGSIAGPSEISYNLMDFDDHHDGSGGRRRGSGGSVASQTSSRRRRGHRGSGSGQQKRWRSGHIPAPPSFSGDIENVA